jgi:hypothetical protein
MPRPSRLITVIAVAVALAGLSVGVTYAAFSKTTSNPGDVITARPDWLPPTVGSTAIAKSAGCLDGYVAQGGTYYVYGNATDPTSNPAAGVANMTANVSAISSAAGSNAVTMTSTGGPWTVNGTSYAYRSASLTASNPLAAGAKAWTVTATDAATPTANTSGSSSGASLTVDNTGPTPTNIVATNKAGGTASKPEQGDTVTFTYSEQIDPAALSMTCGTSSMNVTVRIVNNAGGDQLQIWDTANTTQLPFGTVNLGRTDYVTNANSPATFGPSSAATKSTMTQSAGTLTVTLGTASSGAASTAAGGGNIAWTGPTTVYDRAGNAGSGSFTQTGTGADF